MLRRGLWAGVALASAIGVSGALLRAHATLKAREEYSVRLSPYDRQAVEVAAAILRIDSATARHCALEEDVLLFSG